MIAARPMLAAKAASPRHRRQKRRLREPRRVQQARPALHEPHAADRKEGQEAQRKPHGHGQRSEVDPAFAQSDRHREQQHGQDVVDHCGAKDRPRGPPADTPSSISTADVMPTLVATSATPTNTAVAVSSPVA